MRTMIFREGINNSVLLEMQRNKNNYFINYSFKKIVQTAGSLRKNIELLVDFIEVNFGFKIIIIKNYNNVQPNLLILFMTISKLLEISKRWKIKVRKSSKE